MSDIVKIRCALLSLSDKTGLVELGHALSGRGVEILSTGGTARMLAEAGIAVTEVASYTGFPEMMDGRVKTLHPKVHGGILALRDQDGHLASMKANDISMIDLVVVNLYPFEETVERGAGRAEIIENIDIGGPAMIRSAAKNHRFVTVVTGVEDYGPLMDQLAAHDGGTGLAFREKLAARAFSRTAAYDAAISNWFGTDQGVELPATAIFVGKKAEDLRYGENPHQRAAFYLNPAERRAGVATAVQLQGKALSYNNLNDTDAAFELVSEFAEGLQAVAIIKHANPCGVALGASQLEAYQKALASDPVSAFGGVLAFNSELQGETARALAKIFTEVVIAPGVSDEAREILSAKKNLRLLETDGLADPAAARRFVKSLSGGFLVQSGDNGRITEADLKVVTKRRPSQSEMRDLLFAFSVAKHVKSNAIIYAKDGATVGIGAGQMSRVDSCRIAAQKSLDAARASGREEPETVGSVVASDAFFPFKDGLLEAAKAGATAVIQPGGSIRDDEVIAAADDQDLAMVFTGMRHFRH
ncbi:MAG: bifunctional phosphoribosylaminoimidazolecarboxamide formyltransferase/IMP cyclohydrolase [Sphingomonadales bacterium]